ncbi:MAG: galactokinase [Desulfobacterales bacterium]|jgi:D-glycero-alpha-D-manno-heptose-7-phosphate kinase|nr:galactokinase [Desulfobacterales bacterium]
MPIHYQEGALHHFLTSTPIRASAPCRIDMGGTLDIRSFYLPLGHLSPCTVNIALNLRTSVSLQPYETGRIKVSSKGFDSAAFPLDTAPFNHPMGLIFAVASYFRAEGVHVHIDSTSPPRSALGGSSVAAVALVAAFDAACCAIEKRPQMNPSQIARLAHAIEESVAGVPCGTQDQLAAAFGGVNAWYWRYGPDGPFFEQRALAPEMAGMMEKRLLVAYCGIPHESKDVNSRWVRQFLAGDTRDNWASIVTLVHRFEQALRTMNMDEAVAAMNREMALRKEMTPDVLDDIGNKLVTAALETGCGARISGAGAGGCIWALGEPERMRRLRTEWHRIAGARQDARLLDAGIDMRGVMIETGGCTAIPENDEVY